MIIVVDLKQKLGNKIKILIFITFFILRSLTFKFNEKKANQPHTHTDTHTNFSKALSSDCIFSVCVFVSVCVPHEGTLVKRRS